MRELDAMGLEAAIEAAGNVAPTPNWRRDQFAMAIRAYLDAIEPEGEPDRIAVACNPSGRAFGATFRNGSADAQCARLEKMLMLEGGDKGPFRRQIVRCHLLRPEPAAEVEGVVSPE